MCAEYVVVALQEMVRLQQSSAVNVRYPAGALQPLLDDDRGAYRSSTRSAADGAVATQASALALAVQACQITWKKDMGITWKKKAVVKQGAAPGGDVCTRLSGWNRTCEVIRFGR